ncbi:translocon component PTEX150, putative [Plasmodium vinckei vinckei]|uniref:Translocon component PTEX150, putative n=1 Tax=Plasmodium vinckei vinckei TaxID=54757 RepID=A0A449BRE3_PLAVN|nr:translocon component PTEX150, putative [Plasmodium vinckei vinckei]VEV55929.1 translocon component PTEX150, putative [Plasmodium vinckei vinckei]
MKLLTVKILAIIALINYVSVSGSNKNCSLNIKSTINKGKDDNNDESITPNENDDKTSDNDDTNNSEENNNQDGDALNEENGNSMEMGNNAEQAPIELSFDKLANGDKIKSILDSLIENEKNDNGNNGKDMYKVMMSNIFNGLNNANDSTNSQNDEVNDNTTINISQDNQEQLENLKKNIENALKERGINIDDLSKKYMDGNMEGKDAFIQLLKNMSQDDDIAMNIPELTQNANFPGLNLPNLFNVPDDDEDNNDYDIIAKNNENALNAKNDIVEDNEDPGEGTSKESQYELFKMSNSNGNGQTSNDENAISNADIKIDSETDSSEIDSENEFSDSDSSVTDSGHGFSDSDSSVTDSGSEFSDSDSDATDSGSEFSDAENDAVSNEKPTQEIESPETDGSEEELIVSSSTNNKQKNSAPSLMKNELLKPDNANSSTSKTNGTETSKKATHKSKKYKKKSSPTKTNLRRYPFEQSKINGLMTKFENSDFYKAVLKNILDKYVILDDSDNDGKNNNKNNNDDDENEELNMKEFSVKNLKKLLEDDVLDYSDLTEEELTKLAGPDKAFYDLSPYANEDKEFSVNEGSTVENEQLTAFLNKFGQYHMSYDGKTLDYLKQKKSEKKEEDQEDENFYDAYKQIKSSYSGIPSNYYHQAPQLIGDKYVFTSVYDQKEDLINFLKKTNGKSLYVHPDDLENGNASGVSPEMKQLQKLSYYKRKNAYNILVEQKRIEKEEKENKEKKEKASNKPINDDYIKHLSSGGLNKNTVLFSKDDLDKMVNGLYSESGNSNGSSAKIDLDSMATNIKNSNNGKNDNQSFDSVNDDDTNDNEYPEDLADEEDE